MSKEYPCIHWDDGKCKHFSDDQTTSWCIESPCTAQTMSNADRIRAMSDEELADWFDKNIDCYLCPVVKCIIGQPCKALMLEWLKQPAEEEE